MNAARAATVALIAFFGVAIPATGAAHADEPSLCGLLSPCDEPTGDDAGGDTQPAPVDIDADLDLGLDLDLGTGDHGTDVTGDLGPDVDVELLPGGGTLLDVDADVDKAAVQAKFLDDTVDADANALLDSDAHIGHDGVIVTASGATHAQADLNAAGRRLISADAADHFCGVQIVIAASSVANCESSGSNSGNSAGDGLAAVAESFVLCGAQIVVAGSATTDCGDRTPTGSANAGSSWTLADAAVGGIVCGPSVAVVGETSTSCGSTAQEAPVPGTGPNGPGTGTSGTGTSTEIGSNSSTNGNGNNAASSPAAQPAQSPGDGGGGDTATAASGGSLPLTGTSIVLLLTLAAAVVATGLVAARSSRVRVGHQSCVRG